MGVIFDNSQVSKFATKLSTAPLRKQSKVAACTIKAAVNIKKAVQADLATSSNSGISRIPIEFEEPYIGAPLQITVEIGPEQGAGGLANIAFFGTSKGGGTHQFFEHAEAEVDSWTHYLEEAMRGLEN